VTCSSQQPSRDALLAECRLVTRLRLSARATPANEHLAAIAGASLANLTRLEVHCNPASRIDDAGARSLTSLTALRELSLHDARLGAGATGELVAALALASLDVEGTTLGHDGVTAIAQNARALATLLLGGTGFTDDTMPVLANAANLASLRELHLASYSHRSNLSQRGLAALAASRFLDRELVLGLDGVALGLEPGDSDPERGPRWSGVASGPIARRFEIAIVDRP
jgi:hypothetical protein